MSDLNTILDSLDLLAGVAADIVAEDEVVAARAAAAEGRRQKGHTGGTLVVALVGGTGSGKSSILNAIAGEQVASVSPIRPHTTRPLAWVPESAEPGLFGTLEALGVDEVVTHERSAPMAIVDLADIDSVEDAHRRSVEAILPHVDTVVWVLDPEKYRDRALHQDFVAPLAGHASRFVFALNQVDRLRPEHRSAVVADLTTALRTDGIEAPRVIGVAASPPDGAPQGIDLLVDLLVERIDAKRAQQHKLAADVVDAIRRLGRAAGTWGGYSTDFERRWDGLADTALAALVSSPGLAVKEETACNIGDLVTGLATETGGTTGRAILTALPPGRIEEVVEKAVSSAGQGPERADVMRSVLDEMIADPLREALAARARFGASVAALAVEAMQVEERLFTH